ncbi:MAG: hypothetical protein N4A47_04340 [Clostridia bacterium]|jgi:hypothetical protein|nr:hypothetical protein [Clostridia bacterium]
MIKEVLMMMAVLGMSLGIFSAYKVRKIEFYRNMLEELVEFIKSSSKGAYLSALVVVMYNFILTYIAIIYIGGSVLKYMSIAVIITNFIDIVKIKLMESEKYDIEKMYIYNYLTDMIEAMLYITYCGYIIYLVI